MSATSMSSPFPLDRCPLCGYSLAGLPMAGRCPECGKSYAEDMLVLFGWPPTSFRGIATPLVFTLCICIGVFLSIYALFGLIAFIVSLFTGHWSNLFNAALFAAAYGTAGIGLILMTVWGRRRAVRRARNIQSLGDPRLQLCLSPQGYGFRRGFGPVDSLRWISEMEVDLSIEGPLALLRIVRLSPVGTVDWSTKVEITFPCDTNKLGYIRDQISEFRSRQTQ